MLAINIDSDGFFQQVVKDFLIDSRDAVALNIIESRILSFISYNLSLVFPQYSVLVIYFILAIHILPILVDDFRIINHHLEMDTLI